MIYGLGGGIPEGSFVIFTGKPKTGKTTTALDFLSSCQRPENVSEFGKRKVFFYNIEGRIKPRDLKGIKGLRLDSENFQVIESIPGKILKAEDYLSIGEQFINTYPGSVHLFDSFSALCTDAEITSGMDKMQRADGAKLLAKFCRKVANVIPVNKNIVVGITHLMGNPTGYGAAFTEKSGMGIAYACDVKLWCKKSSPWVVKDTQIGLELEWEVLTSALGSPGQKIESKIRFGEGVDKASEVVSLAVSIGLIDKGGAWYKLTYLNAEDPIKLHGEEKVRQHLVDNQADYDELVKQIKDMLC